MLKLVEKLRSLVRLFSEDDIRSSAATLSFYLLLSFFPMLIFLISVAGRFGVFAPSSKNILISVVPPSIYVMLNEYIREAADISSSVALLSLSFISTFWAASTGVHALLLGINKAYGFETRRGGIVSRLVSAAATLAVATLLMLSALLLVFGQRLGILLFELLKISNLFSAVWDIFRYVFSLGAMTVLFAFLYYISTPFKRIKLRSAFPGAIFTTLGWIFFSTAFSWYLSNRASYTELYGHIGTVIAALIWLLLSCYIILIGAELNAVLIGRKKL